MLSLPLNEITYKALEAFCTVDRRPEDIDLDYKSDWPSDLAKILCAMANTQGGVVLIGIDAPNRLPTWPPIGVEGSEDKLHQTAVNIAFDAIYPPLFPEVRVIPLDNNRSVVFIRVHPTNLLHATDHRQKIHVRIQDHTRGYRLADIDELEWLVQRRQRAAELRDYAVENARKRAKEVRCIPDSLYMELWAIPSYPQQVDTKTPVELINEYGYGRDPVYSSLTRDHAIPDSVIYTHSQGWRTVRDGIVNYLSIPQFPCPQFVQVSGNGLCYLVQPMRLHTEDTPEMAKREYGELIGDQLQYLWAEHVLGYFEAFRQFYAMQYQLLNWTGPTQFQVFLRNVKDVRLALDGHYEREFEMIPLDQDIELIRIEKNFGDLFPGTIDDEIAVLTLSNLFWAYGRAKESDQIRLWIQQRVEHYRGIP